MRAVLNALQAASCPRLEELVVAVGARDFAARQALEACRLEAAQVLQQWAPGAELKWATSGDGWGAEATAAAEEA